MSAITVFVPTVSVPTSLYALSLYPLSLYPLSLYRRPSTSLSCRGLVRQAHSRAR